MVHLLCNKSDWDHTSDPSPITLWDSTTALLFRCRKGHFKIFPKRYISPMNRACGCSHHRIRKEVSCNWLKIKSVGWQKLLWKLNKEDSSLCLHCSICQWPWIPLTRAVAIMHIRSSRRSTMRDPLIPLRQIKMGTSSPSPGYLICRVLQDWILLPL